MKHSLAIGAAAVAVFASCPMLVWAQWVEQRVPLEVGWNSVFLKVDPAPAEADSLFAGLPIAAVWARATDVPLVLSQPCLDNPLTRGSEEDPGPCEPTGGSDWLVWLPPSRASGLLTTLRVIRGGSVYLIQATEPAELVVVGRPSGTKMRWKQGFNLAGFHVVDDPGAAPTFEGYLAPSVAHQNADVYQFKADQTLGQVNDLAGTRITPGRGYWVKADADAEYDGPIEIDVGSLRGVDFAQSLVEHSLTARNLRSTSQTVTVDYVPSAAVPPAPAGLPTNAGDLSLVWLDYGAGSDPNEVYQWRSLPNGWSLEGVKQAGSRNTIRFAVNRAGLAEATLDAAGRGSLYQGLLRVTDGAGFRRLIPITAQVTDRAGLWVGRVIVNQVVWITAGARIARDPEPITQDDGQGGVTFKDPVLTANPDADKALRPTTKSFDFRIIIHRSAAGVCTLLTEATMMWDPGDPDSGTPGDYVIVTPECPPEVRARLQAGSVKDGRPFARRVSTAAYTIPSRDSLDADGDLAMTGDLGSSLHKTLTIPAGYRLNPFMHRFHPDHQTGQDVTREFHLAFAASPPPGLVTPGWGDRVMAGTYTETLRGLHRDPITVRGEFELHRVSRIPTLNAE